MAPLSFLRHGGRVCRGMDIVLKLGSAGRPGTRPTQGRNRAGFKKIGKGKTRDDLTNSTGWPYNPVDLVRPDCNLLTFVILLKRRRFDFLKNKIDMCKEEGWRESATKILVDRALDWARFKNYGYGLCRVSGQVWWRESAAKMI